MPTVWLGILKVVQLARAVVQLVLAVRTAAMMTEQTEPSPLIFLFLSVKIVIKLLVTTTILFLNSAVLFVGMGLSQVEYRAAMTTILITWTAVHLPVLLNQNSSVMECRLNALSTRMPP